MKISPLSHRRTNSAASLAFAAFNFQGLISASDM